MSRDIIRLSEIDRLVTAWDRAAAAGDPNQAERYGAAVHVWLSELVRSQRTRFGVVEDLRHLRSLVNILIDIGTSEDWEAAITACMESSEHRATRAGVIQP